MRRNEELHVNVPSFFRCPISLDVMKSPVSLCTGVTYDRSSIQRWLEDGNNTCPATMQILPTTDLVPNHTLHRLIQIWSHPNATTSTSSSSAAAAPSSEQHSTNQRPEDLLNGLRSSTTPLTSLTKLAEIAREPEGADELAELGNSVPALNGVLLRFKELEVLEEAVAVLALVLSARSATAAANTTAKSLAITSTISSLLAVLENGKRLDSRANAVRILESIASVDAESKLMIAGTEGILPALGRLVTDETDLKAVEAGLSCLIAISSPRRVRSQIVRLGIVPALGKLLSRPSTTGAVAEKALKLLETASTCTEGRAAICEDAACVVTAIVGKMMKVSAAATEHAVVVLWSVCHLFRDKRAQDAVAASNGLTKILLLMQSNCSAAARQMAGDLLKIFRVNSKSCLASYDTKTTHIMPF